MATQDIKCVFNAETGLCNNCGGVGGTPGPCPMHGGGGSSKGASAAARKASAEASQATKATGDTHPAWGKQAKMHATAAKQAMQPTHLGVPTNRTASESHLLAASSHERAAEIHAMRNKMIGHEGKHSAAETAHRKAAELHRAAATPTANSSMEHYEELAFNFSGQKVRKVTLNGRSYTIAPMTLIVPGVLNGSKGRLYYPPEEVAKNPAIWNGRPLTLGHPYDPVTNEHLSASHPGVMDRVGLGVVKNARWDGKKLRADGWFDDEHTQNKAPETWTALNAAQPFELSTGLFTQNDEKPGSIGGLTYDAIARNYRSDHVAVLMNERGACAMKDGCGVFNAAPKDDEDEDEDDSEIDEESDLEEEPVDNCGGKGGTKGPCTTGSGDGKKPRSPTSRTKSADAASAKAEQSGKAMHHMQAVNKHDAAEASHREAGNSQAADAHRAASVYHTKRFNEIYLADRKKKGLGGGSSGSTLRGATQNSNQQETGSMDRTKMLSELTANCSCDKEKAALNELSYDTLKVLHNSKKTPEPPAALTPEQIQVMNYGRDAMQRDKSVLVNRLVANLTDATQKQAMVTNLMSKDIPELRGLVSLLPPVVNAQQQNQLELTPLFMGAGGGPDLTVNRNNGVGDVQEVKDVEWPPVLNYAEMAAERSGKSLAAAV